LEGSLQLNEALNCPCRLAISVGTIHEDGGNHHESRAEEDWPGLSPGVGLNEKVLVQEQ
jgi:hypothetical protein